jgi:vesicle-associated membrane protein 72
VEEVKGIMTDNIDKMLQRGEKLELLTDKTENLMFEVSTIMGLRVKRTKVRHRRSMTTW